MYGTGISKSGTVLDQAADMGIIEKAGSWYSYKGERLGQGREKIKTYLEENPDVLEEVENQIRDKIKSIPGQDDKDDQREGDLDIIE